MVERLAALAALVQMARLCWWFRALVGVVGLVASACVAAEAVEHHGRLALQYSPLVEVVCTCLGVVAEALEALQYSPNWVHCHGASFSMAQLARHRQVEECVAPHEHGGRTVRPWLQ